MALSVFMQAAQPFHKAEPERSVSPVAEAYQGDGLHVMSNADNEFTLALIAGIEALAPIFEAAEGMKADLERRGWSPTVAESVAHQWMLNVMQKIWNAHGK